MRLDHLLSKEQKRKYNEVMFLSSVAFLVERQNGNVRNKELMLFHWHSNKV